MKKILVIQLVCVALACSVIGCGYRDTEISYAGESAKEDIWLQQESGRSSVSYEEIEEIYVSVTGCVKSPGVYIMPSGSRVYEAINAAGGIVPPGDESGVDLVAPLQDGARVYVPGAAAFAATEAAGAAPACDAVNINLAGESELTKIPGIGPSKARAIISYREKNGLFGSVEDIMNISGIKEGTFGKIKDYITIY